MKIWCCLCFSEEDEDAKEEDKENNNNFHNNTSKSMKVEDIIGNDGLPDDIIVNDEDPLVGSASPLSLAVIGRQCEEQLRLFEEMVRAVRGGTLASWTNMAPRTSRRSEGECSSAAAGTAAGLESGAEESRDSYHKRAKVDLDFE